jgi:hypothetical protein
MNRRSQNNKHDDAGNRPKPIIGLYRHIFHRYSPVALVIVSEGERGDKIGASLLTSASVSASQAGSAYFGCSFGA